MEQLVQPLPLALVLVVLGTFLLRRDLRLAGTACIGIAVAGLYLLATPLVSDLLVGSLEQRFPPPALEDLPQAGAIVVLGGGIEPVAPPRQTANLTHAADRIRHGATLYHAGKAGWIITTGARPYPGSGNDAAEAAADLLRDLGVSGGDIVARVDSTSTEHDARAVRDVMRSHAISDVLLVTSALHMPRALTTFQAAGIAAWPAPTDYLVTDPPGAGTLRWFPHPGAFHRSGRAWHEYAGMLYYRLRGWI